MRVSRRTDWRSAALRNETLRRVVDTVTRGVYGLLGSFYLLLGIVVMLLGTGILPSWVHVRIFRVDAGGAFTAREYGAALIGTLLLT